jgi:hypothetical protein
LGSFNFASKESGQEFDGSLFVAGKGRFSGISGGKTDCAVHVAVDEDGRSEIAVKSVFLVGGVVGPALIGSVSECDGAIRIDDPPTVRRCTIECGTIGEFRVGSIAGDDGICEGIVITALDVTMFDSQEFSTDLEGPLLFFSQ